MTQQERKPPTLFVTWLGIFMAMWAYGMGLYMLIQPQRLSIERFSAFTAFCVLASTSLLLVIEVNHD